MSQDRYFKRDDVGIIYQMNVVPGKQRSLIGASLVREVFNRAAYGCRLFCCWCAQDLQANYFWEAMGFVPLAFRTGARGSKKSGPRPHIFWQRRIREGDCETPYWFPAKTDAGAMREDRLVLPIPPGVRWCDEMPVILPENVLPVATGQLPDKTRGHKSSRAAGNSPPATLSHNIALGGLRLATAALPKPGKPPREKKPKVKNDPKLIAAARELRDRYLEQFNSASFAQGRGALPAGKYDLARSLPAPSKGQGLQLPLVDGNTGQSRAA